MTPFESRKLFPHIKTGKVYLNHAANSPLSIPVIKRLNDFFNQRSETYIENYFEYLPIFTSAKNRVAKMLNTIPERIAWRNNVTDGINMLAQSVDWKSGDRIILNDIEFPANVYPFLNLKSKGVEIDFAKSINGKVDIEEIEKLITNRTRLISISHVQFLTGYRADLETIGKLCKEKNIIFCVDAIQGLGAIRLDVEKCNIDFLSCGTQKWLMGMQGLGFIYLTEKLQSEMNQIFVGWLGVKNAWNLLDYSLDLNDDASRFQTGTLCMSAIAVLDASIELMEEIGFEQIENHIISNSKYLISKLKKKNYNLVLKTENEKNIAGIVTIKIDNSKEIYDELKSRNIVVAVREGMIRFSHHYYNTREEIDKIVDIIDELKIRYK